MSLFGFFVLYILATPVVINRFVLPFEQVSAEGASESPTRRLLAGPRSPGGGQFPHHSMSAHASSAPNSTGGLPPHFPAPLATEGSPSHQRLEGLYLTLSVPPADPPQDPAPAPQGLAASVTPGHGIKPKSGDPRSLLGFFRDSGFHLWGKWAGRGPLMGLKVEAPAPAASPAEEGLHGEGSRGLAADPSQVAAVPHERPQRDVRAGDTSLTAAQRWVRTAFFVWLSMQNLIAISTMWARMVDVFSSESATRLFGFLGAGATCGQLVGSILSAVWAAMARFGAGDDVKGRGAILQIAPLLLAAVLLEGAGHAASQLRPLSQLATQGRGKGLAPMERLASLDLSAQPGFAGRLWRAVFASFARLYEGLTLIASSGYLIHICIYMVLSTTIASFLYFEKSMVVAASSASAASRMALFATINSLSAVVIATLQIAATGRLLQRLGLAVALAGSPVVAGTLLLGIAVWPSPRMVATAEVLRKVVGYTLAKPAREVLFTVTTREEKYKAKMCIDTLILRGGDTLAAGLFHVLDGVWEMGPSGCAAAAFPLCMACAVVAYALGISHREAASRARPSSNVE
eukprot:jgi/Botrbrau1/2227/Bobra.101_2s0055.1